MLLVPQQRAVVGVAAESLDQGTDDEFGRNSGGRCDRSNNRCRLVTIARRTGLAELGKQPEHRLVDDGGVGIEDSCARPMKSRLVPRTPAAETRNKPERKRNPLEAELGHA
jgi:hypothetical protein